jgi:ATP-dependent exoDNAse (exonuclease V) alpha subunit
MEIFRKVKDIVRLMLKDIRLNIPQGSTYDNVFVDVNDMIFTSTGSTYANYEELLRRLYVACSRARKELVLSFGR